jgi:hypothetical protein
MTKTSVNTDNPDNLRFTPAEIDTARRMRDDPKGQKEYRAGLVVLLAAEHGLTPAQIVDSFGIDLLTLFADMRLVRDTAGATGNSGRGGRQG